MANPYNRYFELTRTRGDVVNVSKVMRFTGMPEPQQPLWRDVFNRLPPDWDVRDGDTITVREVK